MGRKTRGHNLEKVNNLFIKNLNTYIKFTPKQMELNEIIKENAITYVSGCWGTSKTFTVCKTAYELLATGEYDRIIITKPIVEAGENIGFLRGELSEKIAPYSESYWDTFSKISNEFYMTQLRMDGTIKFSPIAYMRGNNFERSIIIVDEAQNLNENQMMLVMSRLCTGSKMIIVGDKNQTDIPEKSSGFKTFGEILKGIEGVGFFSFTVDDIMREPILIEISKKYEEWKFANQKEKDTKRENGSWNRREKWGNVDRGDIPYGIITD